MKIKETARETACRMPQNATDFEVADAVAVAVLREAIAFVKARGDVENSVVAPGMWFSAGYMRHHLLAEFTPAPVTPSPLPPEVLADALQDRIHPTSGRLLSASPVKSVTPEPPQQHLYSDLKLIDELLCDLRQQGNLGWGEVENYSSVIRRAMLRLRDAYAAEEMPAITFGLARHLGFVPLASEARPTTEENDESTHANEPKAQQESGATQGPRSAAASAGKAGQGQAESPKASVVVIDLSPSPPPEVEQAKSLLNVAIGRWSHDFDAHISDANRELDKAIDAYAAAVTRSALAAQAQEIESRQLNEQVIARQLSHILSGGNASEWDHIIDAAISLKLRAEAAEAKLSQIPLLEDQSILDYRRDGSSYNEGRMDMMAQIRALLLPPPDKGTL